MSSRGDIKWKFFPVNGEVAKKSRYSTTIVASIDGRTEWISVI